MNPLFAYFRDLDADAKLVALHAGRIALILALAWLLEALAARLLRVFKAYMARRIAAPDELPRIETLGRVFRYSAAVLIAIVAGSLVLDELGISVAPILATAGVAGVAIGFGAQSLVKDYFTGFFLLLEDQIRQGDVVEAAGKSGQVEEVTLRHVRLRADDGRVIFIPNGEIKTVVNFTRDRVYAVLDAAIATEQDVQVALDAMREVGAGLRSDARYGAMILGDIELWGVERWELWGLLLRGRIKVLPSEKDSVRREFSRRVLAAFERKGVKMPAAWPFPRT